MAKMMKAAVVRELGKPLAIEEVPVPQPNENQILVRIAATGICHTDLHAVKGDWPVKPKPPFIPGHEGVGTVVATGRAVRSVKEGDRVGIPWLHTACGYCSHCRTGWETLCASQQNTGYSVNGSFAEYAIADPTYVGRLPDSLDWGPAAPILCAGVTVYKGLKETEVKPGEWVVISGIGGLGHLAVQYAKSMGMRVAAVDVHPEKLELAKSLGAEIALNALATDAAGEMQKLIHGAHGDTLQYQVEDRQRHPARRQADQRHRAARPQHIEGLFEGLGRYRRNEGTVRAMNEFLHLAGSVCCQSVESDLSPERLGELELLGMHIDRGDAHTH